MQEKNVIKLLDNIPKRNLYWLNVIKYSCRFIRFNFWDNRIMVSLSNECGFLFRYTYGQLSFHPHADCTQDVNGFLSSASSDPWEKTAWTTVFRWAVKPSGNSTVISEQHPVGLDEPDQQSTSWHWPTLHSDSQSVGSGSLGVRAVLDAVKFLTSNTVLDWGCGHSAVIIEWTLHKCALFFHSTYYVLR